MSTQTVVAGLIVVIGFFSLASSSAAQSQDKYKVRLSTVPMDGGMRDAVAGAGTAVAVLTGSKLTINGTFQGLRSPATSAHLHRGPARGVRGAAVAELTVSKGTDGTITGAVALTTDQLEALRRGQLYVQVSSEKAPDGNLWGWVLK